MDLVLRCVGTPHLLGRSHVLIFCHSGFDSLCTHSQKVSIKASKCQRRKDPPLLKENWKPQTVSFNMLFKRMSSPRLRSPLNPVNNYKEASGSRNLSPFLLRLFFALQTSSTFKSIYLGWSFNSHSLSNKKTRF